MRKKLYIVLSLFMLVALAACGSANDDNANGNGEENIVEEPGVMPPPDFDPSQVNDEYGITVTYWDSAANEYNSRLFALGQMNPSFPEIFDLLNLEITYEDGEIHGDDYTSDYIKVYTFTDSRGYKNFVLKTQYWGEKDAETGIERICYVGADAIDGAITGTIRGPGHMSEDELLMLYPHDLFVATEISPNAHFALNMSQPTKAYIYKDPDEQSRDLAFIVKNGTVVSIDTSIGYEYSRYDQRLEHSKPVSDRNNKASGLKVSTGASYENMFDVLEVLPDYPDADMWVGDDRRITVDIKVPQIAADVPDSDRINRMITDFQPYMMRVADQLSRGNLSVLSEADLVGFLSMDYQVFNYNNAAALVVEAQGYIFHGGGGNVYLIVYYDCDTGNTMTAREYLKKCGLTEESLLMKWAEESYEPLFPGNTVVKSAYDIKFAVNDSGELMLYQEMSD